MEVSITNVTDVEKEILISVPAEELQPHFEKAYREYQPKIEIKGFRKGKAPLDLIKRMHGESIEYESLDSVATTLYRQVTKDREIHPVGEPVLTDIEYKRGQNLSFKIKYEVKPEFELKPYTGIPVEEVIHRVTDKEVEAELLKIRRANSTLESAAAASDDEHIITADIQELDTSGTPLIGKKSADMKLYLSDENLHDEIKKALRGSSEGSGVRADLPSGDTGEGKTIPLAITVKKVDKVLLPDLTDTFAGTITKGKVSTAEEFTKRLRADLESYWRERSERKVHDAIILEIVRRHELMVPESLIKGFLDSLIEEIRNRQPKKQLPGDFDETEFREKNRGYAIFQAKWFLIRERIIEREGIVAGEEDIARRAAADAPRMGIEQERLTKFYQSSDTVKDRIVSEKLNTFLREHANMKQRVTEEFFE